MSYSCILSCRIPLRPLQRYIVFLYIWHLLLPSLYWIEATEPQECFLCWLDIIFLWLPQPLCLISLLYWSAIPLLSFLVLVSKHKGFIWPAKIGAVVVDKHLWGRVDLFLVIFLEEGKLRVPHFTKRKKKIPASWLPQLSSPLRSTVLYCTALLGTDTRELCGPWEWRCSSELSCIPLASSVESRFVSFCNGHVHPGCRTS